MKMIKLLILSLLLGFIHLTTFAQSMEETITWLNEKFVECQYKLPVGTHIYKVGIKPNADKPLFLISIPHTQLTLAYLASPLDLVKISTEMNGVGQLDLRMTSSGKKIILGYINPYTLEIPEYNYADRIDILLDCPDEEVYRIKKGLENMITLLGGNLQKDTIFK